MQRAEGTNPSAEESAQDNGQDNCQERPHKLFVDGMSAEKRPDSDERIELKNEINRPAPELKPLRSEGGNDTEPDKEAKEKHLADSSGRYDFHFHSIRGSPTRLPNLNR